MNWFLTAAYTALRLYIGGGAFDRIAAEVKTAMTADAMTGEQKMARVLAFAQAEFVALSTTAIRAVVELVLLRLKAQAA